MQMSETRTKLEAAELAAMPQRRAAYEEITARADKELNRGARKALRLAAADALLGLKR